LKNGYADANLIAKWKKQGYEKVSDWFILIFMTFPSRLTLVSVFPVVLSPLHPDKGNKLQLDVYL